MDGCARVSAAFLAAVSGLAVVASSAAGQVFSASPALRIPATGEGGTASSFVTSTINVPLFASISDINIVINISHTFAADLDIFLVPPGGGSYLKLTSDNGGSGDSYTFTRFDGLASESITTGAAPFNSNFRPEGTAFDAADPWTNTGFVLPAAARPSLATFNGAPTNGAWTLVIGDDAGGDFGTLNYWSIEFNRTFDPQGPTPLEGSVNPFATLALTPGSGPRGGGEFDAFVTVTPAANPPSTGITVSLDATNADGGVVQLLDNGSYPDMVAGDRIYSGGVVVGPGAVPGDRVLTATVLDAQGRQAFATATFTVLPAAAQWDETADGGGDAGDVGGSAQVPSGTDPLVSISGAVSSIADADLFAISICDPASFSATTFNLDTAIDTQLFLFGADGVGIAFNDDVPDGFAGDASLQSRVSGQFVAGAANYFVGVSHYDNDPLDSGGRALWLDTPFNVERRPDGAGAASAVASWTGGAGSTGTYRINLTGTCFATPGDACDYDFNQDENVDLIDAQQMAQVFVGIITPEAGWLDGDLNGDENADLTDAQLLAAYVVSGNCGV